MIAKKYSQTQLIQSEEKTDVPVCVTRPVKTETQQKSAENEQDVMISMSSRVYCSKNISNSPKGDMKRK